MVPYLSGLTKLPAADCSHCEKLGAKTGFPVWAEAMPRRQLAEYFDSARVTASRAILEFHTVKTCGSPMESKLPRSYSIISGLSPCGSSSDPGVREMHPFIETQKEWMRDNVPPFRPGDTVRVNVRVKEGEKERIQAFEGVCIAKKGGGVSETFTVRKVSNGVGVERIFPLHSPMISAIVVVRRGVVRRAKLYYLRDVTGKASRIKERKVTRAPKGPATSA